MTDASGGPGVEAAHDESEEPRRIADAGQDLAGRDRWGEEDPEALRERLIWGALPTAGLPWHVEEHPEVRLGEHGRVSLAGLAADHATLLVYLAPTELATGPEEDTMGRALRDAQDALHDLGVFTVGIGTVPVVEQYTFASHELIEHLLCSDTDLVVMESLGLPVKTVDGRVEYEPIILIVRGGRIAEVIYPIESPRAAAQAALDLLTRHAGGET